MDLTQLVVDELARIFPSAIIYTENQADGFEEPSFYVSRAGLTIVEPRLFGTQERTYSYQIVYFAGDQQANKNIETTQELLSDNFINLADQAAAIDKEFHPDLNERTLIFNFNVKLRMIPEAVEPMEGDVKINGGIK